MVCVRYDGGGGGARCDERITISVEKMKVRAIFKNLENNFLAFLFAAAATTAAAAEISIRHHYV